MNDEYNDRAVSKDNAEYAPLPIPAADINDCELSGYSNMCRNGRCINTDGSFRCECAPGYTGSNCQRPINPCDSSPCLNHATCNNKDGSYQCHCPFGFTGPLCEVGNSRFFMERNMLIKWI